MKLDVNSLLSSKDNFKKYSNVKSILIKGNYSRLNPEFSIVIPTYKRVSNLFETLESAINQDYKGYYDIIVCDNNPERNDETEKYISAIKDNRIIYYKNAGNIGMTGNWNRCIELCDGKYLVMVHDDDILYPFYLSRCKKILSRFPYIDAIYPLKDKWFQYKDEKRPKPCKKLKAKLFKLQVIDYILGNIDPPTGILINKDKVFYSGGFPIEAFPSADYYFNVKIVQQLNVYRLIYPMSIYRWNVNESFKVETIQKFREFDKPLLSWICKQTKMPHIINNILNSYYDVQNKRNIVKLCLSDVYKVDFAHYTFPPNYFYEYIYKKTLLGLSFYIKVKHYFNEKLIRF